MADKDEIDKEMPGSDQLNALFEKEVHCAGCDGNNCNCGKKKQR